MWKQNWVDAILIKEGALSRRQKEYVFLVYSAANLTTRQCLVLTMASDPCHQAD